MQKLSAPAAGLLSGALAYSIASGFVFRPERWVRHVGFITTGSYGYFSTPATVAGYAQLMGTTIGHFADTLTLPIAIAGAAGLVVAAIRKKNDAWLALPIVTYIGGVIWPVRFVLFSFVFFPAYLLALFAGVSFAAA